MGVTSDIWHRIVHPQQARARRRAVRAFQRSLSLIVDPEALEASVAARLKELFDPDELLFLHLDGPGGAFRPGVVSGFGHAGPEHRSFSARGRLARWLRVNETCLVLPRDHGVLAYLDGGERAALEALDVQVCAPLLARNHLIGLLLLRWRQPGRALSHRDLELLQQLTDQTSLAFENAALYADQQARRDRLHRADRLAAVGQLAAGVAHEVRNPLTAIRSTMQYLLRDIALDEGRHEMVRELIAEVDRIEATISSLLRMARPGDFLPVELDAAELIEQTVHLVEAQARQQAVALSSHHGQRPLLLVGDADQLRQVFVNLILNALQAMPDGGGVEIVTEVEENTGPAGSRRWALVTIADDGPGISAEHLSRVFDPFFTTKHEGTGLGLAICHGIVDRHGGEIELESEGRGTTVRIRLPV